MKKNLKEFIGKIENERKREDSISLIKLFSENTNFDAYLSGTIIGFGQYHYKYESGREGDSIVTGFSPRKQNIAIYIMPGFSKFEKLLEKLGKHKLGKCCIYINKLSDVNQDVLAKIIKRSAEMMTKKYPCKNV